MRSQTKNEEINRVHFFYILVDLVLQNFVNPEYLELRCCFKTLPLPPLLTKTQECVPWLVTRWIWEPRADWLPGPHCHAVNPHHMVRPLGLLTDELGEQVYRLLFQSREGRSSLSGENLEAPAGTFAS